CPLYPQKRTSELSQGMSALCQKRTSCLFDHFVSAGKQGSRHCDAERFGGFYIDHRLELGRRLHRQVGWLLTLQDAVDVDGCAPTGSIVPANTIGTVRVTACNAATVGVAEARMTSGVSVTNSVANLRSSAASPAVQRTSIRTF